ncbi:MAG: hypothetical protein M3R17_05690 [Bacteroidota bacterium]|nr:hypothetical protein [Bacteroidota bacterium]
MKNLFSSVLFVCLALFTWQCKKDEPIEPEPVPAPSTSMRVSFTNMVGTDPLVLGAPYQYVNLNGDSFLVSAYKYYITNISFTDAQNNTWSEPESYHLVDASNLASLTLTINSVPAGNYTSMHFMIGVDSARNVSGAQTGALDPANGMFWTWNTGYIMAKVEGKSPTSGGPANSIMFHVAGYGGPYATQREVTLQFGSSTAQVSTTVSPVVHINSDVMEWFQAPDTIDFNLTYAVSSSGLAAWRIANNYVDMFSITGIDN